MKEYRSGGEKRIWYEPEEIEAIASDELARAGLRPKLGHQDLSVDVEALLEQHLKLPLDQYADLEPEVLGVTTFVQGERPRIALNRDLTGGALDDDDATPGLVGRWRATLAHEVAHVLLHRLLYEFDDIQRGLFAVASNTSGPAKLHRCLKRDIGFRDRLQDWKEVQANMGMSALLMPKSLFLSVVKEERDRLDVSDRALRVGSPAHRALATILSRRFKVSKEAASIRLETLSISKPAQQLTLYGQPEGLARAKAARYCTRTR